MIRVLGCITQQHDLRLVMVAATICYLACFTTISMLSRAASHRGRVRTIWLLGAGFVLGSGVWTTHFIAMLAFMSELIVGYAAGATALSFAIVCCGAACVFALVVKDGRRPARKVMAGIVAGVVLGGCIGGMHYVGISAMRVYGTKSLDPSYVIVSVLAGMALASLALRNVAVRQSWPLQMASAGWLSAGIVLLHFAGMAALTIQPGLADASDGLLIGSALLITVVIAVSSVVLGFSLFGSIIDQYLSQRLAREEISLRYLAHHDPLTGLPNRLQCHERLQDMLAAPPNGELSVAVFCLDLDRFKQVNDLLGHQAGDHLLAQVAVRLQSLVRPTDLVARIGGDEFVVAAAAPITIVSAAALAGRFIDALSEPFLIEGQQVSVGTSVGLALGPVDGATGADLLRNADTALYQAKKDGRGLYRFFEAAMNERLLRRQLLERDLRRGIHDGQLELHYQPLLDVQTKRIVGFEALVRWRHPTRGLVPPNDFIPLAEESGLIIPLGQWVLETACHEAASWELPLRIAVNLSPVQFRQAGLAETILAIVARSGLAPQRLELEITESVLVRHADQAVAMLEKLRDHGVNISLDDFGTGYSSLSYLRRFPFNKIKLDRSFIQSLGEDEEAAVITRAVVALGHSLRLVVTAEGVETTEQLEFLEAEDCTQIQGYFVSKPLPASEIMGLLRTHVAKAAPDVLDTRADASPREAGVSQPQESVGSGGRP